MQNPNDYQLVPMTDNDIDPHIVDLETRIFPNQPYAKSKLISYYGLEYSYVIRDSHGFVHAYLFAKTQDSKIFIYNLGVSPDFRKQGFAKKLMNYLIAQAEGENKAISLRVKEDNRPAFQLYSKLGFITERKQDEYFYMNRESSYQNKKIMWIAPAAVLNMIIKRVPGGVKNLQYIFINADQDIQSQLREHQTEIDYQLILSGGHGDFRGGRPTQLIGKPTSTVEQWVNNLEQKGFKFQNILLHACLSAGFFPMFSRLSRPNGLIFGHSLTATADALSLLDRPHKLIGVFREHYLNDLKTKIDVRDKVADRPFISDLIYDVSSNTVLGLAPQGLVRAISEVNAAIHHEDGVDSKEDYHSLIDFLAKENQIKLDLSRNLCEIDFKLDDLKEEVAVPREERVLENKQHAFFSPGINIAIMASGIIAGVTLICLGSGVIGAAILASALFISLVISLLSSSEPEMIYRV